MNYYSRYAEELTTEYARTQPFSTEILGQIPIGSTILDIGCGSGRDAAYLLSQGYNVHGIDPCQELLTASQKHYPSIRDLVHQDSLPALKTIRDSIYDAITCTAVLMHLPEEQLFDAVFNIKRVLKDKGKALVSIPGARDDVDPETKLDKHGRYFSGISAEGLQAIFEQHGFKQTGHWLNNDGLGRAGVSWISMMFQLKERVTNE